MPTVTKSVRIDATRAQVWEGLASLERLARQHPRTAAARLTGGAVGPGAELRLELADGAGAFTQRVSAWEEGHGLTLDVVDVEGLPVADAHVAYRIEEAGDACVVGGAVSFRARGPLGALRARRSVDDLLVLDALKAAVEAGRANAGKDADAPAGASGVPESASEAAPALDDTVAVRVGRAKKAGGAGDAAKTARTARTASTDKTAKAGKPETVKATGGRNARATPTTRHGKTGAAKGAGANDGARAAQGAAAKAQRTRRRT